MENQTWEIAKGEYIKICEIQEYHADIWRNVSELFEEKRKAINPNARFPAEWGAKEQILYEDYGIKALADKMNSFDAERIKLFDQLEAITPPNVGELLKKIELLGLNEVPDLGIEILTRDLEALASN